MSSYWSSRASLLALLLGLMAGPVSADDNKNESGKGHKRSAESHQRDSSRSAVNPKDSLGANESIIEEHNRPSHVPGERRYEERSAREHRRDRAEDRDVSSDPRGRRDWHDERYAQDRHSATLPIPNGHLSSPGECRIWYPDRPAGHQPPPGNCRTLSQRVPQGAWLVTN